MDAFHPVATPQPFFWCNVHLLPSCIFAIPVRDCGVFPVWKNLQVLNSVVGFDAVYVVNGLTGQEQAS